jgi:hypothetical protein
MMNPRLKFKKKWLLPKETRMRKNKKRRRRT